MIMVGECRLRLVGNSISESGGGLGGRGRSGAIAPKLANAAIALVVSSCPPAAIETVMRRYLNVSSMRIIWAVALVWLRVSCSISVELRSIRGIKTFKTKPPAKCVTCCSIVATAW